MPQGQQARRALPRGKYRRAGGLLLVAWMVSSAAFAGEPAAGERTAAASAPLAHLLQHSPRIYSGGEPSGEAAFAALAELGVRTVVSVDGIRPEIETATKHGLRYVHIPIGYHGISEEAGRSLAQLVRSAQGPFYIHCHHGKHRGPAAAAVACIADGHVDGEGALQILRRAGTSRDYDGLWRDVRRYQVPEAGQPLPALVSVAEVGSVAQAMALIDRAWDRLELCRQAQWQAPPDHADLVAEQEALLIEESFHEAIRQWDQPGPDGRRLLRWMRQSEREAARLKAALADGDADAAAEHMRLLESQCQRCHEAFRH